MKISGHVDLCGPELIEGWLYCDAWENEPIKLQVFMGGDLLGECVADRFRKDLQEAGFGDGRCGFSFFVPEALASSDFAETKLRLVDTPVYLLPDEFTAILGQISATIDQGEVRRPEVKGELRSQKVADSDARTVSGMRRGEIFRA
jgi:hypothetical protein